MRKVGVLLVMVVGISLLIWAGVHNRRASTKAMQEASANRVILTKDVPGQTAAAMSGNSAGTFKGKPAPAFTLVNSEGKKVSLSDYKGRPVLINFWATWCAPCKLEMPWFEEFHSKYKDSGFEILGIAEDDAPKDEIIKTARKTGVSYPILLTDNKVANLYGGVDSLPTSFYVDKTGTIVEETVGLAPKDEVEANIKKIIGAAAQPAGAGQ
ncbi:cytochrome c biogenesis protein CcmG, thiol:disulfide interchange protein DsbE [Granulicella pectinivorans]|uniref:Cytochrome c biogenesis protein CcmG, thiol:disulfide interchange protein DsbE n=1 Tax=Granulicella pectinivorans TaxID=474950 RepID=A0A1I6M298_9BACT|nr:TlpA disulfide reductase family protein [Granulicella pectinivorans]SFS09811.1 cytochrome c biogenesis protein CcmG, thiol:disulfide interchange protein DsbE [Granulicella pectinivorans]